MENWKYIKDAYFLLAIFFKCYNENNISVQISELKK